jgi:transcriptional regulator with XRE-family HTH domain
MAEYRFAGNRLREAREQHDPPLSRKELAAAIERSESMVTLWELDYRQPLVEKLIEMAAILDVPVEAFFVADGVPA